MGKVYGYGRLALANKKEMVEQLRLIDDYCNLHGLKVDRHFFDNGISGLVLNRKELNQMIDVLQEGDVIVIRDMARLSRNMFECMMVVELIANLGVTLKIIY